MHHSSNSAYQSREDRLRELERERLLYSTSLQNMSDTTEEPKWEAYKPSTYDVLYPEFASRNPSATEIPLTRASIQSPSRSRSRSAHHRHQEENPVDKYQDAFRYVSDSTGNGRSAYLDLDQLKKNQAELGKITRNARIKAEKDNRSDVIESIKGENAARAPKYKTRV